MNLVRASFVLAAVALVGPRVRPQDPATPPPPPEPSAGEEPAPRSEGAALEWTRIRRPEFLSVLRDGSGKAVALRTSVVRFAPIDGEGPIEHVDLVGAVHVGDRAYYDRLNALFASYDVVLFEMAHKEDPREELDRRRSEPDFMKLLGLDPAGMLGLESQVARIDYRKPNFVHADTSLPDAMERRGDDWISVMAGLLADLRRQGNLEGRAGGAPPPEGEEGDPDAGDPLGGLLGPGFGGDPLAMKRRFAAQLESQGLDGIPGFTTLNDLLVAERNKVAMKRFEEQVAAGRRRLAIFYGAAHMRDFTQRLVVDHGLRPVSMAWIEAWDLRDGSASRASRAGRSPLGGEVDRDAAHDLVDRLFDLLEQALREEESPAPRRRGR